MNLGQKDGKANVKVFIHLPLLALVRVFVVASESSLLFFSLRLLW
jgi:hypothetical protein